VSTLGDKYEFNCATMKTDNILSSVKDKYLQKYLSSLSELQSKQQHEIRNRLDDITNLRKKIVDDLERSYQRYIESVTREVITPRQSLRIKETDLIGTHGSQRLYRFPRMEIIQELTVKQQKSLFVRKISFNCSEFINSIQVTLSDGNKSKRIGKADPDGSGEGSFSFDPKRPVRWITVYYSIHDK
jgi:predicted HAD superfamily phosphohydrolase